jgi:hypothetical protein
MENSLNIYRLDFILSLVALNFKYIHFLDLFQLGFYFNSPYLENLIDNFSLDLVISSFIFYLLVISVIYVNLEIVLELHKIPELH